MLELRAQVEGAAYCSPRAAYCPCGIVALRCITVPMVDSKETNIRRGLTTQREVAALFTLPKLPAIAVGAK